MKPADSHPAPPFSSRTKPMINEQAANAFKTAKTLTACYTRLDVARDCITIALDNLPKDFDIHQIGRINDIRNILSREMAKIWDLRESEERRNCEQPPAPPEEEVWVTQDLVPDRPNFDQWRWVKKDGSSNGWHHTTTSPYFMHGYHDEDGDRFEVRCRRKNLPTHTPPENHKCPDSAPADDQTNLQLAGSHGDYSLPVMDIDVQIFPPDPKFIQVDNPGIPALNSLLSNMLKDAYHKPVLIDNRVTSAKFPIGGLGGV